MPDRCVERRPHAAAVGPRLPDERQIKKSELNALFEELPPGATKVELLQLMHQKGLQHDEYDRYYCILIQQL